LPCGGRRFSAPPRCTPRPPPARRTACHQLPWTSWSCCCCWRVRRLSAAHQQSHPTDRVRLGAPTLQTLQDPILLTPWLCFRAGGFPNPNCVRVGYAREQLGQPLEKEHPACGPTACTRSMPDTPCVDPAGQRPFLLGEETAVETEEGQVNLQTLTSPHHTPASPPTPPSLVQQLGSDTPS
jgi:hypothetical protein